MEEEHLSNAEIKAVHIIFYATQNHTPDALVFGQLYALANGCRQNRNEDDYQAVLRVVGYLLEAISSVKIPR